MNDKLVQIKQLKIYSDTKTLVDISFSIKNATALIGQSGSGKSLSIKALLDMLPSNLHKELSIQSDFELNRKNIAYVPQNPFTSLSPLTKIKQQFMCSKSRATELLNLVNIPLDSLEKYPMELSGGQLQRTVIAIAIQTNPKLLLLDEPTTALDSKNKKIILDILNDIKKSFDIYILFVTHDIMSVKDICEDIVILKDGSIIEEGKLESILNNPKDEYTKNLLSSSFANRKFRV
ncbi:MAG TPA: ABC transporter ATP-binding protein [Arcobacter sp.]|nr:ABC transporter ATP-binding protein [Arcobacter sp.]